jgi:hemolysin activation/secretion protein
MTAWTVFSAAVLMVVGFVPLRAQDNVSPPAKLFVREYRVKGARQLSRSAIEAAVYPYLGPGRTADDIEHARAALEAAYRDQGYQTVSVQVPRQDASKGVIQLEVVEAEIGRLRVNGATYFSPAEIKKNAPSLAEGTLPNFNAVTRDITALNRLPDRRITPSLSAGKAPGTVDVDLNVEDTLPLHGSLELNNRYSADTTHLRLNGSMSYGNLWQAGHTAGLSFQVSPEDLEEVKVFSGYYLIRVPDHDRLSVMFQGTIQDSNVSTLGGAAVNGRGQTFGIRAIMTLPSTAAYYQSFTYGIDYKHYDQDILVAGTTIVSPITYYPLVANYAGTYTGKNSVTDLNLGVTFHLRGAGSGDAAFNNSRFNASGGFIYLTGSLDHTRDLPAGFQFFAKGRTQVTPQPLLSNEQITAGGVDTVRGYLEAEASADAGATGTLELRSPSLASLIGEKTGDWRVYLFADGGVLHMNDALPGSAANFELASVGFGTRLRVRDHFSASMDAGIPLLDESRTEAYDIRYNFSVGLNY